MTTQQATLAAPGIRVLSAIGGSMGAVVDRLRAKWRARQTHAALQELDPRILRDIGIEFSDVMVLTTHGIDGIYETRQRVIHRFARR